MDKRANEELIEYILLSIKLIEERFDRIDSVDDFMDTKLGLEKLDAISMRLQTIGEAIKNMLKRDSAYMESFADKSYWSDIIKFREIISHHYIDIDSEIIFDICQEDIGVLKKFF